MRPWYFVRRSPTTSPSDVTSYSRMFLLWSPPRIFTTSMIRRSCPLIST